MITLKTLLWATVENVTIRTKGLLTTCPSLFPVPAKFGFADICHWVWNHFHSCKILLLVILWIWKRERNCSCLPRRHFKELKNIELRVWVFVTLTCGLIPCTLSLLLSPYFVYTVIIKSHNNRYVCCGISWCKKS